MGNKRARKIHKILRVWLKPVTEGNRLPRSDSVFWKDLASCKCLDSDCLPAVPDVPELLVPVGHGQEAAILKGYQEEVLDAPA